jgi:excisionase family DNA binding protein
MLTVKGAAQILNVSPALVYALCTQGAIEHERYGLGRGTIRISDQALSEYQERARIGAVAPTAQSQPRPVLKHLTLSPVSMIPSGTFGPGSNGNRHGRSSSDRHAPSGSPE